MILIPYHCHSEACLCVDEEGWCGCQCPDCRAADEFEAEKFANEIMEDLSNGK